MINTIKTLVNSKGLTLVELMVAIAIFVTIVIISFASFININSTQKKLRVSQEIYEDARFLMEKIVKEVRQGSIDYEEYWNKIAIKNLTGEDPVYGDNYGAYAQNMINPGIITFNNSIDTYGTRCVNDVNDIFEEPPCPAGYRIDANSIDKNYGINPMNNPNNPDYSNAVCDGDSGLDCAALSNHVQNELYLISLDGTKKTIIKRIPNRIDDDFDHSIDECDNTDSGQEHVGIFQLDGQDLTTKSGWPGTDGIIDTWHNAKGFIDHDPETGCAGSMIDDFVSLSSPTLEVISLKFIISPLEDPRKAFNEESSAIQIQPHVTIILTAKASAFKMIGIRGIIPEITIQTTVSTRSQNEIKSF